MTSVVILRQAQDDITTESMKENTRNTEFSMLNRKQKVQVSVQRTPLETQQMKMKAMPLVTKKVQASNDSLGDSFGGEGACLLQRSPSDRQAGVRLIEFFIHCALQKKFYSNK
jgi:hypothetical protein